MDQEMIETVVKNLDPKNDLKVKEAVGYWLSKTAQEGIAPIEFLRR